MALTRARIGQPMIRGRAPRSPTPQQGGCYQPTITETFTIATHVSNHGTSQIPYLYLGPTSDVFAFTGSNPGWFNSVPEGDPIGWEVSSANPPAGETYHLRATWPGGGAVTTAVNTCVEGLTGGNAAGATFVCAVGDILNWSFQFMRSASLGEYTMGAGISLWQPVGSGIYTNIYFQSVDVPGTSYGTKSGQFVIPDQENGVFFDNINPIYLFWDFDWQAATGATFPYTPPVDGTTVDIGAVTLSLV